MAETPPRRRCLVDLVQAEFREMPGMRLSKRQAQRLWNLDARTADDIFDALEASNFLKRVTGGAYMRADIADRCRSRNFAREHAHPRPEHPTVV